MTADRAVYDEVCRLRNYGQREKHVHAIEGFNSRLDELQAAILSVKLARLDAANERRRRLADIYRMDLEDDAPVVLPVEKPWAHHVYHLYVIRTPRPGRALPIPERPRHRQPRPLPRRRSTSRRPTAASATRKAHFPEAEKAASEILSLPLYPGLTEEEVVSVCSAIKAFYAR